MNTIEYILCGMLLFMMIGIPTVVSIRNMSKKLGTLKEKLEDGRWQYEDIVEENRKLRQIRHDLQKQISIIKKFEGVECAAADDVNVIQSMVFARYNEVAANRGIWLEIDVEDELELPLNEMDKIGLLSNLLDNAIEACEQCEGEQWIEFSMKRDDNDICICIKNAKMRDCSPMVEGMRTTKSDKERHGYGMQIIQNIVEKYNGSIDCSEEDESFQTEIRFCS